VLNYAYLVKKADSSRVEVMFARKPTPQDRVYGCRYGQHLSNDNDSVAVHWSKNQATPTKLHIFFEQLIFQGLR